MEQETYLYNQLMDMVIQYQENGLSDEWDEREIEKEKSPLEIPYPVTKNIVWLKYHITCSP